MVRQVSPTTGWDEMVRQYAQFRTLRERSASQEERYKKDLLGMLEATGEEEDSGHKVRPTSEPVTIGKKTVVGFRRQRRVSQKLNADKAEEWLQANGMLAECQVTQTFLDEDAILGLNFSGNIPDQVFKGWYEESETFALTLIEGDDE